MVEAIAKSISLWVTNYLAIFCLVTLVVVAGGRYLVLKKTDTRVRDFVIYLCGISVLSLLLTLMPLNSDSLLWPPIAWFCFAMLLMLELLWIAFMAEALVRLALGIPGWFSHRAQVKAPSSPHDGSTPFARM